MQRHAFQFNLRLFQQKIYKFLAVNAKSTPKAYVYPLILLIITVINVEWLAADVLLNRSSVGFVNGSEYCMI